MKLSEFIIKNAIIKTLKATTKNGALEELVDILKKAHRLHEFRPTEALDALLKREKIGSTGIGHGLAIPHAKTKGITRIVGAFARSEIGIDFNALDGDPVNLIFLVMAPQDDPEYLQALQRVSQAIKHPNFSKFLRAASDTKEIFDLFREVDTALDKDNA